MNQGETWHCKRRVKGHPGAGGAPDPAQTARNKPAVLRLNVRPALFHCGPRSATYHLTITWRATV
jgi:hypothetical protein